MTSPYLNSIISQRIDLGPELLILRIVPNGWEFPAFKAGQFAVLGLAASTRRAPVALPEKTLHSGPEKFIRRAYSIASSPLTREYVEFYITLVREGALTPRMWTLKTGDRIWLSPKISGQFTMDDVGPDKNLVFIATGTGVAPFVSMLQTFLGKRTGRMALFHGVRHSQDLAYRPVFSIMQSLSPAFSYFPIISRPADNPVPWHGAKGHVGYLWQNHVLEKTWGTNPDPGNTDVFLCGNPDMIVEMTTRLKAEGFREHKPSRPGNMHVERYW